MALATQPSPHTFHIPVMGTGFTIDTPLRVARYGISSVISLVDDVLIEQMRQFHSEQNHEPFTPITEDEDDFRARRITAYLNLVGRLVSAQVAALQAAPFEPGSELTRYFELLPDGSPLKAKWHTMLETDDPQERARRQEELRPLAVPGSIDVNIMTKLDRDVSAKGEPLPPEQTDAVAAMRGFAMSDLNSSLVLSAGLNPRLYGFMASYPDFLPRADGTLPKKIVLKVSDYRSAQIQGKFLAKRGLWVSEYRIESGLNCGGHAFASAGHLMGPILEEFRHQRTDLIEALFGFYNKGIAGLGCEALAAPPEVRITVQGGVGTAEEHNLLLEYYAVDGVGWATPFLLVPEVTNVDPIHLEKLAAAGDGDVRLSGGSPLGIEFWALNTSSSEETRLQRVADGRPGSPCPKGFLRFNTEFTERPICTASAGYQRQKLKQIAQQDLSPEHRAALEKATLEKACICHDLAGGATRRNAIDPTALTSICPGPNIVNFNRVASLEEMIGHIYGRVSLLANPNRPHMFLRELRLYLDYLHKELDQCRLNLSTRAPKYFEEFRQNLEVGIDHYRGLASQFVEDASTRFLQDLAHLQHELEKLSEVEQGAAHPA